MTFGLIPSSLLLTSKGCLKLEISGYNKYTEDIRILSFEYNTNL